MGGRRALGWGCGLGLALGLCPLCVARGLGPFSSSVGCGWLSVWFVCLVLVYALVLVHAVLSVLIVVLYVVCVAVFA